MAKGVVWLAECRNERWLLQLAGRGRPASVVRHRSRTIVGQPENKKSNGHQSGFEHTIEVENQTAPSAARQLSSKSEGDRGESDGAKGGSGEPANFDESKSS